MEHFSYGEGLDISMSPGIPHPNTYNWAWREYGNRVGVWRLLELFGALGLPISVLLNSGHQNDLNEAGEAALIAEATDTIARHEGKPPAGWLSPGVNPSDVTPDLLQEAGYTYILDAEPGTTLTGHSIGEPLLRFGVLANWLEFRIGLFPTYEDRGCLGPNFFVGPF